MALESGNFFNVINDVDPIPDDELMVGIGDFEQRQIEEAQRRRLATTTPEPTFPGTTTPIGNIARSALSNFGDYRNLVGVPRIGNTQVANLIRGRAGRTAEGEIDRYSAIRNRLGAPRLQDTELAKIINRTLTNPEESPGFKLGQNVLGERRKTQRENLNEILQASGLAGSASGIGIKALNMLDRQGDVELGNLALQEGSNAIDRSMRFQPMVEDAFNRELDRGLTTERQGVSDLYDLERSGQGDFLNELRLALGQEELAKNRDLSRENVKSQLQAALGLGAGQLAGNAIPRLLDALFGRSGSGTGGGSGGLTGTAGTAARQIAERVLGLAQSGQIPLDQAFKTIQDMLAGGGTAFNPIDELGGRSLLDLEDIDFFGDLFSGGGGGGGFDLPGLGEFDDFGSFFSDFFDAGAGAAGAGAGEAAGGASTFGDLGINIPGLSGLSLAAIPASIIGGGALAQIMGLFSNAVAEKEKAREKSFSNTYFQQIRRDPQAWVNGLAQAWGPQGKAIGEAALAGKINNSKDLARVIMGDEAGNAFINELESLGDTEALPLLSQWATRFIAAPGEKWHGPILIESSREKVGQLLEALKNPETLLAAARERKIMRDIEQFRRENARGSED